MTALRPERERCPLILEIGCAFKSQMVFFALLANVGRAGGGNDVLRNICLKLIGANTLDALPEVGKWIR